MSVRGRARRAWRAAAVTAVPALVLTVAVSWVVAGGEPLRISLHLSSVRLASGDRVVASVVLRTGASAETVAVGMFDGGWRDDGVSGSPLAVSDPALIGPGRGTGGFSSGGGSIDPYSLLCARGAFRSDGSTGVDVALPAHSTTTLRYTVRLAARPWPWMTAQIGVYTHTPSLDPSDHGTTRRFTRSLVTVGTAGVRITLRAPTSRPGPYGDRTVRAHRLIPITGTTQPTLPGTPVDVVAAALHGPDLVERRQAIATTRTDRHGRFRSSWHPRTPGIYVIQAATPRPPAPYTRDSGCDLEFIAR